MLCISYCFFPSQLPVSIDYSTLGAIAQAQMFSTAERTHGGLKDSDRIFTNLYRDGDPYINGALKNVGLFCLF